MPAARRLLPLLVVLLGVGMTPSSSQAQGVSKLEYEGWRQYNAQCGRCHGQDVLGNPVAPALLKSVKSGGPAATKATFVQIVAKGKTATGMPAFAKIMSAEQIDATYAYVKGRAEGRIPAGRPKNPGKT